MPSVPQSLLWISLVVLWLFVLVPMLISKRDAVRRTSDVALATRVLNGGLGSRRLRRGGPAAGHRSDPDWQPEEDVDEVEPDVPDDARPRKAVVVAAIDDTADTEPTYIDVDVIEEDSGALPVGSTHASEESTVAAVADADQQTDVGPETAETADEDETDTEPDGTADEYEYVEDTSGLESGDEPPTTISSASRRRRYDSAATAAAISARKYKFRKRVVTLMVLALVGSAVAAFTVWPSGWWLCAAVGALTVLYMGYLRRQTRIEERLRRRRAQRIARSRLGVENTEDPAYDVTPSRLRRPGTAVLEIDDEDPIFEHLDYAPGPMEYHLPRAAGQ
jgi:hypothetical protein